MALHDLESFSLAFPEFAGVDPDLVQSCLTAAEVDVDADVWGARQLEGHGVATARRLSTSPFGNGTAMVPQPKGENVYDRRWKALTCSVSAGLRYI